ncbi:hypothetical protein K745_gp10 [Haloarcula hispanica virus PH1]|uniref:Uncharacterized protein n=1 Tax=Haloarcula hispanica virus PH1 TaxID=1282967 RepID=M4JGG0_9VIRU|nr:hypothetical protein K745_gp10 [Haloarcula hispanica virus PH1]AGC65535.1 hypothetical protein HhPH1_gp10 [Haloarcula hispanica virus PH1]
MDRSLDGPKPPGTRTMNGAESLGIRRRPREFLCARDLYPAFHQLIPR